MVPAPAVVAHPAVVRGQKGQCEKLLAVKVGSGRKGLLALDHGKWVLCQPSAASSTTQKSIQAFKAKLLTTAAVAVDHHYHVAGPVDDQAATRADHQSSTGCETPKSERHRIPVVDVDLCPPAPKKPRATGRFALLCASMEREGASSSPSSSLLHHKLGTFSPGYLF